MSSRILILIAIGMLASCGEQEPTAVSESNGPVEDVIEYSEPKEEYTGKPMFTWVAPTESGVHFRNSIDEDDKNNILDFDYFYNGGGVAVGDLNGDDLPDLYFCGNMAPNKLYFNKGDLQFEDVTESSGAGGSGWSSGATIADVNGDGHNDIYVTRSFDRFDKNNRRNLLFINNGDGTFSEKGATYLIDDASFSIHSAFFDHDLDGDLDLYVTNHPKNFNAPSPDDGDKGTDNLYENNGDGTFSKITYEAGVRNFAFGLGLAVGDVNGDGYPDLYVANDYDEPDHLYMNNGDGTYTDGILKYFKHISNFGMGIDLADFNNDGLLDLIEMDMMAEDNYRQKVMMSAMAPDKYWDIVAHGKHHQFMRNTLQLNNGNGYFSDVAFYSGVHYTDWSWAPLFADFDNDGNKDLIISNGFRRDWRFKDVAKEIEKAKENRAQPGAISTVLNKIPANKLANYYYENNGDLTFTKRSAEYGFEKEAFSQGMAYADLDNDGDLDVVVNNLLDTAFIYRNDGISNNNYLRVALNGPQKNPAGFGAKVTIYHGNKTQHIEQSPSRGYLSSVEQKLHFGLGKDEIIDRLRVEWPGGKVQEIKDLAANQVVSLRESEARVMEDGAKDQEKPLFAHVTKKAKASFEHEENEFNDYDTEILLPHKMSQFGPHVATGDVNGDGTDDIWVGGAAGQAGALMLQGENGRFSQAEGPWSAHAHYEDIGCVFFDTDGDSDLDLYVVSGGNEFRDDERMLQDRLYLNNGDGTFTYAVGKLPKLTSSGSRAIPGDMDADGDLDLFVGGRVVPGKYPFPADAYLLENRNGEFFDVTDKLAPEMRELGLVTDAVWTDHDADGDLDLIVVGEWMPITIFDNNKGKFTNKTEHYGFKNTTGWWNSIAQGDFDNDGDMDYIAGNLGLNYKYLASKEEPLEVYAHDFDKSGTIDIVLGYYNDGNCFPVRGRQCSSDQMPFIKEKFPTYHEFGSANLEQVYGEDLEEALHYQAKWFANSYIENQGNGRFAVRRLPRNTQYAPITGIATHDLNGDGNLDMVMAGNLYMAEVETGRADAGTGNVLLGNGDGTFESLPVTKHGFFAHKDVRDVQIINAADGATLVVVTNNDDAIQIFRLRSSATSLAMNR